MEIAAGIATAAILLAVATGSYLLGRKRGQERAMDKYASLIDRCLYLLDQVYENNKRDRAYRDQYGEFIDAGKRGWN